MKYKRKFVRFLKIRHFTYLICFFFRKFHCTRPNCDKSYMTARMLQKHLATHDSISRQPRICEKCGSQLASLSSLNKHLTTVHAHDDKFEELEPKRKRRRKRVKKPKEEENL